MAVVLEGAARVLEERGVAGFNTNAVAERAGVSVGTVYQYFPHKDALLAALLREDAAALLAAVDQALAPRGTALETTLERLVDAAVRHQAARPRLSQALDAEQRRLLPLDAEAAALAAAVATRIAGALAAHAGRLPRGLDPTEAAADVVAIARAVVDRDGEAAVPDPAALRRRVRRAVFGYLGLPP